VFATRCLHTSWIIHTLERTASLWIHTMTGNHCEPFKAQWSPVSICITCFNKPKLCNLPTQCICVFCMIFKIKSDCFPKQH
jgi:hypothetical protein